MGGPNPITPEWNLAEAGQTDGVQEVWCSDGVWAAIRSSDSAAGDSQGKGINRMRYVTLAALIVLAAALALATGCGKKAEKATTEEPVVGEGTETLTVAETPKGKVLVDEEVLNIFVDEPEQHFKKAHELFVKKDTKAAAHEIRMASGYLKLEAGRATGDSKKALEASSRELDKLADDVEKGAVVSEKEVRDTFARADYALAMHHHAKAKESWEKGDTKQAGVHLMAAPTHLEYAKAWLKVGTKDDTKAVVRDTRTVAGKLTEGVGFVPEEVGKVIEALGKEIDKLGREVEPPKGG
jgi:hypothetical protein